MKKLLSVIFLTILVACSGDEKEIEISWSSYNLYADYKIKDFAFNNSGSAVNVGLYNNRGLIAYTSDNGGYWRVSEYDSSGNRFKPLNSVSYCFGKYYAVGDNSSIYSSTNGSSWVKQDFTEDIQLLSVACSGSVMLLGAKTDNSTIYNKRLSSTTDGISWSAVNISNVIPTDSNDGVKILYYAESTFFLASDTDRIGYSSSGTSDWKEPSLKPGSVTYVINTIAKGSNYTMIGQSGASSSGGRVLVTKDYEDWDIEFSDQPVYGALCGDDVFLVVAKDEIVTFNNKQEEDLTWTSQGSLDFGGHTPTILKYGNGFFWIGTDKGRIYRAAR